MKHKLYKGALIKPFVYTKPSISDTTLAMFFMLCIQVIMLVLTKSYNAVLVIVSSSLGCIAANYVLVIWHKTNKFSPINPAVQGMLVGMLLPESYPIFTVLFVTFFTFLGIKIFTGHLAHTWCSFVAVCVILLWVICAEKFPVTTITHSIASAPNPSLYLIQNGAVPLTHFDVAATDFFNRHIFHVFNVSVPQGYISMLWDNGSQIPAFRFNFIIMMSSILLISIDMIAFAIPFIFLATYGLAVRILMPLFFGGAVGQGDVLLSFLTGGTFFCAIYLLQWFGTVPSTTVGKIVYAFIGGWIAFFVSGYGTSAIGMVFTIFIADIISAIIQMIEEQRNKQMIMNIVINMRAES